MASIRKKEEPRAAACSGALSSLPRGVQEVLGSWLGREGATSISVVEVFEPGEPTGRYRGRYAAMIARGSPSTSLA
jgi:hypothetical protein